MKNLLLSSLIICFSISLFSGCKKDPLPTQKVSSGNWYVKMKINGQWQTFGNGLGEMGEDLLDPALTDVVVTARKDKNYFDFSIQLDGSNFIEDYPYETDDPANNADFTYITGFATAGSVNYDMDQDPDREAPKYTVVFTEITNQYLKGTFTGNYLRDNFQDNGNVNITEGEFKVKRIR